MPFQKRIDETRSPGTIEQRMSDMDDCLKEISYRNRYEHWVIRLHETVPASFAGIVASACSVTGMPEYIIEYLRCPGCGSMISGFEMSMTGPARHGDAFVYLARCGCGKIVTVENYIDYGDEVPWPGTSGIHFG